MRGNKANKTGLRGEALLYHALHDYGYKFHPQIVEGIRPHGGRWRHDAIIDATPQRIAIEIKGQEVSGTGWEKVPYAVLCYEDYRPRRITDYRIVLFGNGWPRNAVSFLTKRFPKVVPWPLFEEILRSHSIQTNGQEKLTVTI